MAKSKKVIKKEMVIGRKIPTTYENPNAYFQKKPTWSFQYLDNGYKKWGFIHANDINESIISKLKAFEGMTWGEIMQISGGRNRGTNSHFENISDLIPEAQKRWKELKLDEYDRIFSLRLAGTQRLYCILENGILKIVWHDPIHEIYSINR